MKNKGSFYVILAAILWGILPMFVRYLKNFSSFDIVFLRCFFAFILLAIYLIIKDKSSFKIKLKDLWCFIGTGIISVLFFNYCYYESIKHTSLSIAAILMYTAPCFVMILSSILFKERITKIKILSLIIAFLGCIFVSGIFSSDNFLGVRGLLIGLGSGFGYALYSIFSRFAINRGYKSSTISLYTFLCCSIGVIPLTKKGLIADVFSDNLTIFIVILFAFLTTVLAYIFYTKGLELLDNSTASIIACIEPVTATFIGFMLYSEIPDIFSFLGLLFVLGSTILVNLKKA